MRRDFHRTLGDSMAKIKIENECDIHPTLKIKNIPNPHTVYPEIKEILISRCKISPKSINERIYEHEKGTPEKIHILLEAWKQKDKYTKLSYKININMVLKQVNKGDIKYIGDIEIDIKGTVETIYPQETTLQKSIVWDAFRGFYEKVLYGDLRDKYIDDCKKYITRLKDGIQAYFNLLPKMF